MEKVLLKVSQKNSQKNTCARVFFLKKVAGMLAILLKKRICHRCFLWILWNFEENVFYRIPLETDSVYRESRETFSQLLPEIFVVAAIRTLWILFSIEHYTFTNTMYLLKLIPIFYKISVQSKLKFFISLFDLTSTKTLKIVNRDVKEFLHTAFKLCIFAHGLQITCSEACCRSSHQRCSIKKLFLKISQYSQENTRVGDRSY